MLSDSGSKMKMQQLYLDAIEDDTKVLRQGCAASIKAIKHCRAIIEPKVVDSFQSDLIAICTYDLHIK